MSNIAIKGATTGTGTFTIESPATNTDRTLTLPDEAGTVLTSASTFGVSQLPSQLSVNASASSGSLAIDSAGRVTMPYQPAFAYVPSSQTSATSESPINFETATISSADFNSSLSRFTAPVAGKYLIQVSVAFYVSGDCRQIELNLLKNGSIYRSADTFIQQTQGNNTHTMAEVAVVIDLNANDYINTQWNTYPSTTLTRYISTKRCMFQGYLIG